MTGQTFIVKLTPERCTDPADGIRRLRAFLKGALRSYGLRCTELGPGDTARDETDSAAEPGENHGR